MKFDIVGSFLPPQHLIDERRELDKGVIDARSYALCEDKAIRDIVERQLAAGLDDVTSGELRRRDWDKDFYFGLNGISRERIEEGRVYQSGFSFSNLLHLTGRIGANPEHPFIEDFRRLYAIVDGRARCRQTLPSPSELYMRMLTLRVEGEDNVYTDLDTMADDIAAAYRGIIDVLYAEGCRHVQFDDTVLARFADPQYMAQMMRGGVDAVSLHRTAVRLISDSYGEHDGMVRSIYLSHGPAIVPKWYVPFGGSATLAQTLSEINVDRYYLPFDIPVDPREIAVLGGIPQGRTVALGLVNPHSPYPDNSEDVIAAVHAAEKYMPASSLSISPMCGFKLSEYAMRGLTYEDQWKKLDELRRLAAMC